MGLIVLDGIYTMKLNRLQ